MRPPKQVGIKTVFGDEGLKERYAIFTSGCQTEMSSSESMWGRDECEGNANHLGCDRMRI